MTGVSVSQAAKMDDHVLIELVGQYPLLWSGDSKLHKEQTVRDNTWRKIASMLNADGEQCKKRWKNIRDHYFRKRREGRLGSRAGSGAFKYKEWTLEKNLSFLDNIPNVKRTNPNIKRLIIKSEMETELSEYEINPRLPSHDDASVPACQLSQNELSSFSPFAEMYAEEASRLSAAAETAAGFRRYHHYGEDPFRSKSKKRPATASSSSSSSCMENLANTGIDEIDANDVDMFFRGIAKTVNNFPPVLVVEAKRKVFNFINDLEYKALNYHNN